MSLLWTTYQIQIKFIKLGPFLNEIIFTIDESFAKKRYLNAIIDIVVDN